MFVALVASITTKVAIEMLMSGAAASISLLCVGSKVRKRK